MASSCTDEPTALFSSCCELKADKLVCDVLELEELPESVSRVPGVSCYPWHINTKYYSADIRLGVTTSTTIGDETFADSTHGLALLFDPDSEESFSRIKAWLPYCEQLAPSVKLLICQTCSDNAVVSRMKVLHWCIDNEFELIELDPEIDPEDEDFGEIYGIARVRQALHAHPWGNLVLKDEPDVRSPLMKDMMASIAQHNGEGVEGDEETFEAEKEKQGSGSTKTEEKQKVQPSVDDLLVPDSAILAAMKKDEGGGGEDEDVSFEKMFAEMAVLKDQASLVPEEQRRAYAEQVTLAFWKAIGGDPSELEGLSDDSD